MSQLLDPHYPASGPIFGDSRDAALAALARLAEAVAVIAVILIVSGAPLGLLTKTLGKASPLLPANWALMWAAAMMLVFIRPRALVNGALASWPLVILLGWTWASLAWSISPYDTMIDTLTLTAAMVTALVMAAIYRWPHILDLVVWIYAALAVLTVLMALGVPSMGVMGDPHPGAWSGPWLEKNATGRQMALGFLAALARLMHDPAKRRSSLVLLPLFLLVILMSTSKTALLLTLASSTLVFAVWLIRRGHAAALLTIYGGVLVSVAAAAAVFFLRDDLVHLLGRDLTFTGRTEIWKAVWVQIQKNPLLGYGYEAFWVQNSGTDPVVYVKQATDFTPANAHSAWLDQWLGLGIVGLGMLALYLLWGLGAGTASMMRSRGAYLTLPLLVTSIFVAFSESILYGAASLEWFLMAVVITRTVLALQGRSDGLHPAPSAM